MRIFCLFAMITLVLAMNPLRAQEAALGDWLIFTGNKQWNDHWNWEHSIQYRSYNAIGDLHQLLIRNGVGYNLSKDNNNLSIGYDYILDQQYDDSEVKSISKNEHRIYQQFSTKQHFGRFYLKHRYRFEERFIAKTFNFRCRYALFINVPLNHAELKAKTIYFSAYNEVFVKTGDDKFDQNWLYGGIGYQLNKSLKLEFGYMNQFFMAKSRDQLNIISNLAF